MPIVGTMHFDANTFSYRVYDGCRWHTIAQESAVERLNYNFCKPTQKQLEDYPALKDAWEHFLSIKKLVGL